MLGVPSYCRTIPCMIRDFLHSTRAGATAIVAVAVTVMAVGGAALLIEHARIDDARDVAKSASAAVSVAATRELNTLPAAWTDQQVEQHLLATSRKWAEFNVLASPYGADLTPDDVIVTLAVNRTAGTVDASVEVPGHEMLLGKLFGASGAGKVRAGSGAERVREPVDVVLAIDISRSMEHAVDGSEAALADRRIEVARRAALDLIGTVGPSASIALVPWTNYVNTDVADWPVEWADRQLPDLMPATVPLTRDHSRIREVLVELEPGLGTLSTLGLFVANSYLRAGTNQHQAVVLLTDGRDNTLCPGRRTCSRALRVRMKLAQCTRAKSSGARVFVVTAMSPEFLRQEDEDELRACSSEADDPTGRYVFIENATAAELAAAFEDIANQLQPLRRTY